MATVVLVGTFDTKGIEYEYVRQQIQKNGVETITMDIGVLSDPEQVVDITAEQVARAAGVDLRDIRFDREGSDTRAYALETMQEGAAKLLSKMVEENRCDAVMGMGGSGGTSMLSKAFMNLPTGFPKLIVSTCMAGDITEMVGTKDMTMMYSVTDIAGLNRVSRMILGNAANAVSGMAKFRNHIRMEQDTSRPLIAITMYGITTKGVLRIRNQLETKGFDTIIFHCTGSGGAAMEEMISQGLIDGVIDYTLAELNGHKISKMNDAGESRLTAAVKQNIPQIVVPGALEVCNFPGIVNLPSQYNVPERKPIEHNHLICAVMASETELKELAGEIGRKLKNAGENTRIIIPMEGLDSYMAAGGPWSDADVPEIVYRAIEEQVQGAVIVEKLPYNINDTPFADRVAEEFIELWEKGKSHE